MTTRHSYSPLNVQRSYESKSSEVIYSIYIPKSGVWLNLKVFSRAFMMVMQNLYILNKDRGSQNNKQA